MLQSWNPNPGLTPNSMLPGPMALLLEIISLFSRFCIWGDQSRALALQLLPGLGAVQLARLAQTPVGHASLSLALLLHHQMLYGDDSAKGPALPKGQ